MSALDEALAAADRLEQDDLGMLLESLTLNDVQTLIRYVRSAR